MRWLCLVLALVMVGCQGSGSEERVLRLAMSGDPDTIDPRLGFGRKSQVVANMLFEGLTRMAGSGPAELALAESVVISQDGCQYTFRLREAQWSNGEPVTAWDFEQSWKRNREKDFPSVLSYQLDDVHSARAVDSRTFVVDLVHPAPYFLDLVSLPIFAPVPARLDQEEPNWSRSPATLVTNGPFVLEGWDPSEQLSFRRNPHYWDRDRVEIDAIELAIIEDPHSTLTLFQRGELDWIGEPLCELPFDALPELRNTGLLTVTPVATSFRFYFNTQLPLFSSPKVRRALALAIDREAIIEQLYGSTAVVATSLVPQALTLGEFEWQGDAQALFREGLEEMGVENVPLIVLSAMATGRQRVIAQAVQQMWRKGLGIEVELALMGTTTYFARLNQRDFQVGGSSWLSWKRDAIDNLDGVRVGDHLFNWTGWEDPTYQALLEAADGESDAEVRRGYLAKAEAIAMEAMPIAPICEPGYASLAQPGLTGVAIGDTGIIDFKGCRWAT